MFDTTVIKAALEEKGWVLPFEIHEEIDSTNLEAKRRIREGALPDGGLIVTERQTAGKGRMGRVWSATDGKDLTFSLFFPNVLNRIDIPKTSLAAALGICHAVEKDFSFEPRLKWPNDILVDGKKVCGILSEYVTPEEFITVGVGINVNSTKRNWNFESLMEPTSLKVEGGSEIDRAALMASCAVAVRDFIGFAKWEYFPTFQTLYETKAFYDNMRVEVHPDAYNPDNEEGKTIEGIALGIDRYGALRVRDDSGRDHLVRAGDMVLPSH